MSSREAALGWRVIFRGKKSRSLLKLINPSHCAKQNYQANFQSRRCPKLLTVCKTTTPGSSRPSGDDTDPRNLNLLFLFSHGLTGWYGAGLDMLLTPSLKLTSAVWAGQPARAILKMEVSRGSKATPLVPNRTVDHTLTVLTVLLPCLWGLARDIFTCAQKGQKTPQQRSHNSGSSSSCLCLMSYP